MPYAWAVLLPLLFSLALTPLVRRFAPKFGLVDMPNARRINKKPMPTGGGVAIFFSFLAASLLLKAPLQLPLILGGGIVLLVGLLDDSMELKAGPKFLGQLVGVLIFVLAGPRIEFVTNPWGGMIFLGYFSIPITVFWMMAVVNIMNFIDGLDGLSAGISLISCTALFTIAFDFGRADAALLAVLLAGAIAGFLPYNFNPARIYLGDAGAMFLGFMLGAIAAEGALKGAATIGLSIPTLILAVPTMDTVCNIVRRVRQGVPVYQADRGHFHHRLLDLGWSQRRVVLFLYMASLLAAAVALYITRTPQYSWVVLGMVGMLLMSVAWRFGWNGQSAQKS